MFTADPNITDLRVKEKVISKLFFSMNSPQIATPELGVEEARCYILLFRSGNSYSAYIGLYLPNSDRRFYYAYSGNPVPEEGLGGALDEASRFAEEMGFLLDELNLVNMSVDERNQWIDDQVIFGYKKKPEDTPEEKPGELFEANPPEHPAPGEQPVPPGEQAAPVEQKTVSPSPPELPMDVPHPLQEPPPAAETQAPKKAVPAKPQPAVQQTAHMPGAEVPLVEQEESVPLAAKSSTAKPQKPRAKKTPPSPTGTVSREYEALARLLASF